MCISCELAPGAYRVGAEGVSEEKQSWVAGRGDVRFWVTYRAPQTGMIASNTLRDTFTMARANTSFIPSMHQRCTGIWTYTRRTRKPRFYVACMTVPMKRTKVFILHNIVFS